MKKNVVVLFLCFIFIGAKAQYTPIKYRVTFTDKTGSPYTIGQPEQFLSQKAIDRRTHQGITIKANDIPVNAWYVDSLRHAGAVVFTTSKWFNCVTIYTLDTNVIKKIGLFPFVLAIDTLADALNKKVPRVPKNNNKMNGSKSMDCGLTEAAFAQTANFYATSTYNYGLSYTQAHMIGTDFLHEQGFRGQGMTIAVLDAGFFKVDSNAVFDSLWINNQILGTKDFVTPGGDVFDRSSHGMMVLSIMGGNVPGSLIGTAPKANFWLLRSEDADTEYPVEEDNWVAAAEFADSVGADVINSSLGYTEFFNPAMDYTYADMNGRTCRSSRGAATAASKGILVVNSAGNSGNSDWHFIGAPADADSILTIGSVNNLEVASDFSSRGPTPDSRIKPSVCAMGEGTFVSATDGSIMFGNGTSFSSPVMAGSVACLWQANPHLTNLEVISSVMESANRFMSPDSAYGYGVPNLIAANLILGGTALYNFDKDSINVFPSPFDDFLTIMFSSADTATFDIFMYDMEGKMVFSRQAIKRNPGCNYVQLKGLTNLHKGNYLIKVVSEKNVYATKLIKLK
ncbi:MAG: S8 family serine peptidase [Bacteroidota bacterium]